MDFSNKINLKSQLFDTIDVYVLLMQIHNRSMVLEVEDSAPHSHTVIQTAPSGMHSLQDCHKRVIENIEDHTCSFMYCPGSDTLFFSKPQARTGHINLPNTGG